MNPFLAFVALLVLAYLGGLLSDSRIGRNLGLASGVEYVMLGVLVGPHALGFFKHGTVVAFAPLLLLAVGWLAAVLGIQYARYGGERVPRALLLSGILIASVTGAGVFVAVYAVMSVWGFADWETPGVLALGTAAVCSGSAHQAVHWATGGQSEERSVSRALGCIGSADNLPPMLIIACMGFVAPHLASRAGAAAMFPLVGLGLGLVLGATVAALLGGRLERSEFWPVLLGAVFLVVGLALRLDLPLLSPAFVLGLTVAVLSPHRQVIRELVKETERPLLVPALLLAGVLVEVPKSKVEWAVVAAAVSARALLQFVAGCCLAGAFRSLRGNGTLLGQALLSAGGGSLMIALAVYFGHPGQIGRVVLFVALMVTVLGELWGGRALRRVAALETGTSPGDGGRADDGEEAMA